MGSTGDKPKSVPNESKEERVARITAKQTIIVTVITVVGARLVVLRFNTSPVQQGRLHRDKKHRKLLNSIGSRSKVWNS